MVEEVDADKIPDDHLALILDQYEREGSYTVIYTAGPRTETPETYTPEFQQDGAHVELKRQLQQPGKRANVTSDLPLFEKYQYFTPGSYTSHNFFVFFGFVMLVVVVLPCDSLRPLTRICPRHLHGPHRPDRPDVHLVRRHLGPVQPRGFVRRLRQGDGSCCSEEAAVNWRKKDYCMLARPPQYRRMGRGYQEECQQNRRV